MISVGDMAEEPLIVPDRRSRPHSHDLTMKLFLESGHAARVVQIAEEKQTIVSLVGTGIGLAISCVARSVEAAMAIVPIILMANLLLGIFYNL